MRAVVLSHRSVADELGLLEPWLDAATGGRIERRYREDGAPTLDADPAHSEPIVAAVRAAEESADPPKARVDAVIDAFGGKSLGR